MKWIDSTDMCNEGIHGIHMEWTFISIIYISVYTNCIRIFPHIYLAVFFISWSNVTKRCHQCLGLVWKHKDFSKLYHLQGPFWWRCRFIVFFQEDLAKLGEIENSLAIFCLATYGEGDPTDNAQQFYDWLQNGDAELNGLKYAASTSAVTVILIKLFGLTLQMCL